MWLFKQYKIGKIGKPWGYIIQVAGQGSVITTTVMMAIQVVTLASVLQLRGIMVPVWLLGFLAFSIVGTAGIIIFKLGNPSYFAALNEQAYKHDNPIRRDIEENKKVLEEIKKTLTEIKKTLTEMQKAQYEKGD